MPSFLRNGVLGTLVSLRLPQLLMVRGIADDQESEAGDYDDECDYEECVGVDMVENENAQTRAKSLWLARLYYTDHNALLHLL